MAGEAQKGIFVDFQNAASKIQREHLDKLACIYVRQSTAGGVKKNVVGGRRQREDVIKLALQLGWPEANIKVIDADQAMTGSSTHGRYGYQDMLNLIAKECVGAVFSLESSRMARDSTDWHCLIKICHLTGTLVIDPDGVYDASDSNDSTLMKLKALLVEMELRLIYQRIAGARRDLAEKGLLRSSEPIGYVYGDNGKLILDPNEEVRAAVRLVFTTFARVRSSAGVAKYFLREKIKFPSLIRSGPKRGEYKWVRLKFNRARSVLGNPVYTGTYVYGRSVTKRKVVLDKAGVPQVQKYSVRLPREAWNIVIHDAHESYITWSQYLENQERIRHNGSLTSGNGNRAARVGGGLLQGIVVCGKCGRRMAVRYPRGRHGPYYICTYESECAAADYCQSFPGEVIDAAIEKLFLQAVEPAELNISFEAVGQVEEQLRQRNQLWAVQLKRAKSLVQQTKDRLLAVDFNNKYAFDCVQEELKKNEEELLNLNRQHIDAGATALQNLTPDERQSIEKSIKNLPSLWAATTDMVAKKNLLRCLIKDVTIRREGHIAQVAVRWKTLANTRLTVNLRKRGDNTRIPSNIIEFIAKLAPDHNNTQIANELNETSFAIEWGPFCGNWVARLRRIYRLAPYHYGSYPVRRKDGRYQLTAVVKMLKVDKSTVTLWCRNGRLDAVHEVGSKLWWIRLDPEQLAQFKETIRRSNRFHQTRKAK